MVFKKLLWTFKRHPALYKARFRLLSKNSSIEDIAGYDYNEVNPREDMPFYFEEVNTRIFKDGKPGDDLDRVKAISVWLNAHIKGGPGLSEASEHALKLMLEGKGGVCSDMTQIFNNFCVLNDLQVREWGVTRAPFDKDYGGHSFNEVYCKEFGKWVLIDPSWGFIFYDAYGTPLSVLDVYHLRGQEELVFKSFLEGGEVDVDNLYNNYLDARNVPFLICNYSNKTYDTFLKVARPFVPVFILHFTVFMLQKSYHYRFPMDDYKRIFL
ncbi:transglutaminase-like domain-containing protein [Mangrovimonas xylaniphaga]|uniref:transglutaminase-like domain-containing protein n=1 Tax=Mangrovimonas xylaniphaga TaxID=1645915 RepID=UPI0006B59691|nr:transglutaminase-like domain-containing protein [Mangrovimonas xylaniphaga]